MNAFSYVKAESPEMALKERGDHATAAYIAGGTNLIDYMKLNVEQHERLIDVNKLSFNKIEAGKDGGLLIGATVRNSDLAHDERVMKQYPGLSEALLSGASPQLRNLATTAGNLLQRTRCYYFRDMHSPCNKRQPGSGCAALDGFNRIHAILGTSDKCIATHPSDMDVAMMAFDAVVHVTGNKGERTIPISQFYVSYGEDPAKENTLEPGDLITAVELPNTPWFKRSTYFKARDRASYEFALSSALVAMDIEGGTIRDSRVVLGGVATLPWRATEVEKAIKGQKADDGLFTAAAEAELKNAKPHQYNAFKVELSKRVIIHTLKTVAAMA